MTKRNNPKMSKEQKEQVLKLEMEAQRQRKIVKDKMYPVLLEQAETVQDAIVLCKAVSSHLQAWYQQEMAKFQASLQNKKLSEIGVFIEDKKDTDKLVAVVAPLSDETVRVAGQLLEGMPNAIDSFVRENNAKTKLKDLQTHFL